MDKAEISIHAIVGTHDRRVVVLINNSSSITSSQEPGSEIGFNCNESGGSMWCLRFNGWKAWEEWFHITAGELLGEIE
ncbi:hypothetical protein ACS0TY_034095 [Phlomoides rotata]